VPAFPHSLPNPSSPPDPDLLFFVVVFGFLQD
jgi:hypothetical protein